MHRSLSICALLLSLAVPALAGWDAEESAITSAAQIKDITKETPGYKEIADLVENHYCFGTDEKGNFRPAAPLTHAAWAVWLNNAVTGMMDHFNAAADGMTDPQHDKMDTLLPSFVNPDPELSVSKVKDLKADAPYFDAVRSLVERFGARVTDAAGNMNPDAPVTGAELAAVLKGPLHYDGALPKDDAKLTRAEVAVYLDKALVRYDALITAKAAELKGKK